jgi:hypothetical protein
MESHWRTPRWYVYILGLIMFIDLFLFDIDTAAKCARAAFRRLPFTHCALSFQPFDTPMCSPEDGSVFDLVYVCYFAFLHLILTTFYRNILPFVKKFGINPVTGKPLTTDMLVALHYHKNADGLFIFNLILLECVSDNFNHRFTLFA